VGFRGNILDKDGLINNRYYYKTASPSKILFDKEGNSLKRSYIGPINIYKQDKIFNESKPFELIRELKRVSKERRLFEQTTKLKGKHELSSVSINRNIVQSNQNTSSPFLLLGSPLYKRLKETQRLRMSAAGSIAKYEKSHENSQNKLFVEEKVRFMNTENLHHRNKRS
jgi:hypothetical protein